MKNMDADELIQVQDYLNKRTGTLWVWAVNPQAIESLYETVQPIHQQAESLSDEEIDTQPSKRRLFSR